MLDAENPEDTTTPAGETQAEAPAKKAAAKRAPAKKAVAKKVAATAKKAPAKRTTRKVVAKTVEPVPAAETPPSVEDSPDAATEAPQEAPVDAPSAPAAKRATKKAAVKKAPAKRATKKAAASTSDAPTEATPAADEAPATQAATESATQASTEPAAGPAAATALLFQPPDPTKALPRTRRSRTRAADATDTATEGGDASAGEDATTVTGRAGTETAGTGDEPVRPAKRASRRRSASAKTEQDEQDEAAVESSVGTGRAAAGAGSEPDDDASGTSDADDSDEDGTDGQGGERRRRRRGGRRRRRSGGGDGDSDAQDEQDSRQGRSGEGRGSGDRQPADDQQDSDDGDESASGGTRRRRRRRRSGEGEGAGGNEAATPARVRKPRNAEDEITAVTGSTRLEAKKQRRREGREAGRRRAPIVSEAEFLARREAVDRVMVIRQHKDLTQIAVLEDKVLVEHYVARESQTSLIGNVYLGRVQNVLPSMEAAFIDIGKGRNAVLYAGEVNWDALGAKNGTPRKIEAVLKSGQSILVQVTKDPIGHKGARLTSQVSLPGRFLVYVPDGTTSGISRKLPDTERNRLKTLLKEIVPESAGVIVRTAAEGASEEELTRDVERLTARWEDIEGKVKGGNAPQLLYGEPDLTLKVVRDLFTEDFKRLVIAGDEAWDMVEGYVEHVAPDLSGRLERYDGNRDVFAEYRIDEQIEKALDRKVWLPSGGSLVIDRTEAMTVVDVNTGKFTGSGGNLEETVTKNNLEAAEEIVRQLRLRDIGGIIVVDFIDMVLESNRDLVLRRMVECLGRDRTRHQVAEVTSLGLVQMTRKRIGTGLLEAFSESCEHCQGRGLVLHHEPVEPRKQAEDDPRRGGRRGGRSRGGADIAGSTGTGVPSPKDIAAMARPDDRAEDRSGDTSDSKPEDRTGQPTQDEGGQPSDDRAPVSAAAPADDSDRSADSGDGAAPGATRTTRGRRSRRSTATTDEGTISVDTDTSTRTSSSADARSSSTSSSTGAGSLAGSPVQSESIGADSRGPEATGDTAGEPVVTTTSRGRGRGRATRAAGVPTGGSEPAIGEPQGSASGSSEQTVRTEGQATAANSAAETSTAPAGESAQRVEPTVAAAPRIVTSTRRRSARRPAGPPSGVGEAVTTSEIAVSALEQADGVAAIGGVEDESGDQAESGGTPHVPVKKKGTRRR